MGMSATAGCEARQKSTARLSQDCKTTINDEDPGQTPVVHEEFRHPVANLGDFEKNLKTFFKRLRRAAKSSRKGQFISRRDAEVYIEAGDQVLKRAIKSLAMCISRPFSSITLSLRLRASA
jgi:hypothetical protein